MDFDNVRSLIDSSKEEEAEAYKLFLSKIPNGKICYLPKKSIFRKKGFKYFYVKVVSKWGNEKVKKKEYGLVNVILLKKRKDDLESRFYEFFIFCSGFGGLTDKEVIVGEDGSIFQVPDSPADLLKGRDIDNEE